MMWLFPTSWGFSTKTKWQLKNKNLVVQIRSSLKVEIWVGCLSEAPISTINKKNPESQPPPLQIKKVNYHKQIIAFT